MARPIEMSKIEARTTARGNVRFCVVVLSAVTGTWIVQGEHLTKAAAEADLRNWR